MMERYTEYWDKAQAFSAYLRKCIQQQGDPALEDVRQGVSIWSFKNLSHTFV